MSRLNLSCFYNDTLEYDNNDCFCEEKDNKLYKNNFEEINSEEESSTNSSFKISDSEENENELDRLLPSNILRIIRNESNDSIEKDNNENEKEKINNKAENKLINFANKLNINSVPFIPKSKLAQKCSSNNENCEKEDTKLDNNANYFKNNPFCYNMKNNDNSKKNINKKKLKKKQYIQKEGDWPCYDCKNINFSFRNVCNRCKLPKEESEKKYKEAGERFLKLFNINQNY